MSLAICLGSKSLVVEVGFAIEVDDAASKISKERRYGSLLMMCQ